MKFESATFMPSLGESGYKLWYIPNVESHDLALTAVAFFSEVLGTLSGFGSSTFFVPAGTWLESFRLVLALTAMLHCFGNSAKIFLFRDSLSTREFYELAIPSILATAVGAWFSAELTSTFALRALGFALVIVAAFKILWRRKMTKVPLGVGIGLAVLSGFLTGFLGTGGAVRGVALSALMIPKNSFVALSSAIDFGGDAIRLIIYLYKGYMDWSQWYYVPMLAISAVLGVVAGF